VKALGETAEIQYKKLEMVTWVGTLHFCRCLLVLRVDFHFQSGHEQNTANTFSSIAQH
jgi:hypothetical protein